MKAHKIQQEDGDLTLKKTAHARRPIGQSKQAQSSLLEAQLAKSDVEIIRRSLESLKARNERIEALKTQVNDGTYQVNSTALAQKMAEASSVQRLLGLGRYSILDYGDEE